jgi:hypothetical protein
MSTTQRTSVISTKRLERRLRHAIRGEVRFDNGSRALYSTDSSNYRQIPICVVVPRAEADVIETVAICRELGIPITSRGGGTSLAGQCCNVAVIIDFSKYLNHLIEADPDRKIVRVEPGIIYDHVNRSVAKHKLAFAPDPSTHTHCTVGGMIPMITAVSPTRWSGVSASVNADEWKVAQCAQASWRRGKRCILPVAGPGCYLSFFKVRSLEIADGGRLMLKRRSISVSHARRANPSAR